MTADYCAFEFRWEQAEEEGTEADQMEQKDRRGECYRIDWYILRGR